MISAQFGLCQYSILFAGVQPRVGSRKNISLSPQTCRSLVHSFPIVKMLLGSAGFDKLEFLELVGCILEVVNRVIVINYLARHHRG